MSENEPSMTVDILELDGADAILLENMGAAFEAATSGDKLGQVTASSTEIVLTLGTRALEIPFGMADAERFGPLVKEVESKGGTDKMGDDDEPTQSGRATEKGKEVTTDEVDDD